MSDVKVKPPAKEVSTARMMLLLAEYVKDAGEGVFGVSYKGVKKGWSVMAEFGREAPDSPMVGGAAYGMGDTLREALEPAGADCGLWEQEEKTDAAD